jgi:hypothetical protein
MNKNLLLLPNLRFVLYAPIIIVVGMLEPGEIIVRWHVVFDLPGNDRRTRSYASVKLSCDKQMMGLERDGGLPMLTSRLATLAMLRAATRSDARFSLRPRLELS